jgi:chaperonin GroES
MTNENETETNDTPFFTRLKPLGDRLVIRRLEDTSYSPSGLLHIPDAAKELPQRGEVVAYGPDVSDDALRTVGTAIFFGKYSGTDVTVDDAKYIVMREEDVLAVMEEGE